MIPQGALPAFACPICGKTMVRCESFWACGEPPLQHGRLYSDEEVKRLVKIETSHNCFRILQGDVFETVPTIAPGSVDVVVTSPPYWMLRSYLPKDHPLKPLEIGQEKTAQEYVEKIVRVFGLVRNAMADHATAWLNIGDTYAASGRGTGGPGKQSTNVGSWSGKSSRQATGGFQDGDLALVPQRLAIALQDDGWIVRSIIVWHKPAPMPASVAGWRWKRHRVKLKAGNQTGSGKQAENRLVAGFNERWYGEPTKKQEHGHSAQANGKFLPKAEWSDCPGCPKCLPHGGYVLRKGSWRPTSSWEPVLMLAKGSKGVSRIVKFSDLPSQLVHFGKNLRLCFGESSSFDFPAPGHFDGLSNICVRLAAAIYDGAQLQEQFGLPPFYAEEWKKCFDDERRSFVPGFPIQHRPAALAARFLTADLSTKDFLEQNQRLGVTLSDANHLCIAGVPIPFPCSPSFYTDGKGTVAIHDSGKVCKIEFSHGHIVFEERRSVPYFCDGEAVKTPAASATLSRNEYTRILDDPDEQFAVAHDHETVLSTANLRDTWTIAAEPLKEKHYAAFPTELVHRCLAAGTSARGYCPTCGGPWCRVLQSKFTAQFDTALNVRAAGNVDESNRWEGWPRGTTENATLGWRPSCSCPEQPPRPGLVLDPFAGSGRTGIEARRMGLDFIGCELNPGYVEMSQRLAYEDNPLFSEAR